MLCAVLQCGRRACLQDKKSDKNFGKACRSEVERFEQETAKDYRLNYRLYNACKGDIGATCKNACELKEGEICGGKVREVAAADSEIAFGMWAVYM